MYADTKTKSMTQAIEETSRRRDKQLEYNKKNNITPLSIKKSIDTILESTAEQDHVTVDIENAKQLVGKDLDTYIKTLDKKMNDLASKLEFEDAALIRDEINRLRAKQMGLNKKALEYRK